ncbi:MAG: TonB-dependent receptor [Dysgonamonadaceae bacterium]|jgi:hypothetical protein|nr:TonB-dependent receptor [Dysgonamonadaceae bacterium]
MKQMLPFVSFALFLLSTLPLYSQTQVQVPGKSSVAPKVNVTVKGQVVDSISQESIPYVTLKISESGNPAKVIKLLSTDADGKFNVILNQPGKFDLHTQTIGKGLAIIPFEVTGKEKAIDLSKINLSDTQLGEVVVTAIKPLVAVDLDKITYNMQEDPDSKTSNVLDMMRKVPMITVDGEDKIQLKGSSGFKIYMDGKPSNLISSNPTQVLRSMPASMVKNIEVITDPGAKYDAEGVTGIINIITNKQPMGGYTANLGAGVDTRGGYDGSIYATLKYGKLGFTGNYNYGHYQSPKSAYSSYREIYNPKNEKYLYQNGSSKNEGNYQYGTAELSYDLDTANLITASFNKYGGSGKSESDYEVEALDQIRNKVYSYDQNTEGENTYGTTNVNVDYQRTFKKKDELLTASYRFNLSPNDSWSDSKVENATNYFNYWQKSDNDAKDKEHTFQVDYTTPFAKYHTLEAGVKYIIRLNESNTDRSLFDFEQKEWKPAPADIYNEFKYRYDILAGYLGYNLRYKDYGFKAGLRLEDTQIEAEYPLSGNQNFDKHYFSGIPSTTVTYRYKMVHTFRLGYNLRIQRPGIYYLNPYVNNTDPKYVSSGNPDLDVEKAHNIDLNYSVFKPKVNLSAGISYNFNNNSIQRVTEIREDVSYTTFENIGKQKRLGINLYFGWNPINNLRLNLNGSGGYVDIRTNNDSGMKNSGITGFIFGNVQYTLPKDFRLSGYGGGGAPQVSLQGKSSSFYFYGLGLNKSFLNKKLNVSINTSTPFNKFRKFSSRNNKDPEFYSETNSQFQTQSFGLRVSYQFGEMKQQAVKKARRGITNDDSKAGESDNSSGGGQQGGTGGN